MPLELGPRHVIPIWHQNKDIREMLLGRRALFFAPKSHTPSHRNHHHQPRVLRPLHHLGIRSRHDLRGRSKPVILVDDVHVESLDFVLDFALLLGKSDEALLLKKGVPLFGRGDDLAVDADVSRRVRGGEVLGVGVDVAGGNGFAVGELGVVPVCEGAGG